MRATAQEGAAPVLCSAGDLNPPPRRVQCPRGVGTAATRCLTATVHLTATGKLTATGHLTTTGYICQPREARVPGHLHGTCQLRSAAAIDVARHVWRPLPLLQV